MRIAMTGATGRVGSRLLPRLTGGGHQLRALVRDLAAAGPIEATGAEAVHGGLRDRAALDALVKGADAVVHLAAVLRVPDPAEIEAANVAGTAALADAAEAAGVRRVIFASTNLVYPGGLGRPATEDDEPNPLPQWGAYPPSKVRAERDLLGRAGLGVTVLRLAFVYGEGDPHLAESLRWAGTWQSYQRLHMVHHADVAGAVLRTLAAPHSAGRIYNVADEAPASAVELHQLTGRPYKDPGAGEPDLWHGIVSTRHIATDLGFHPLYPSAWTALDSGAL